MADLDYSFLQPVVVLCGWHTHTRTQTLAFTQQSVNFTVLQWNILSFAHTHFLNTSWIFSFLLEVWMWMTRLVALRLLYDECCLCELFLLDFGSKTFHIETLVYCAHDELTHIHSHFTQLHALFNWKFAYLFQVKTRVYRERDTFLR